MSNPGHNLSRLPRVEGNHRDSCHSPPTNHKHHSRNQRMAALKDWALKGSVGAAVLKG